MKKAIFILSLCLLVTTHVLAQSDQPKVTTKFLIEGGVEYGGDEILQVFFTNGEDQKMLAGQGLNIGFGGELKFSNIKQLMVRGALGFKYSTTAADNANIMLIRFPVHLTPFWRINNDFRLGIGITTHLDPTLRGDGFLPNINYNSTAGPRFEFGYKWAALTYTAINYEDRLGESFSASSIGITLSGTLPNR